MPSQARSSTSLDVYERKRRFDVTPEPPARRARRARREAPRGYVIQKHWASHLHYDFRLEHDGVLLSWAVPKGPSLDPRDKRMAVHVEDHPVDYGGFEGTIPANQYGAGEVIVWDRGSWEPVGDVDEGLDKGKLVFRLHGEKLAGLWELVRTARRGERGQSGKSDKREQWLLFKKTDEWARPHDEYEVTKALPDSVIAQPLGLLEERAPAAPARQAPEVALPDLLKPQLATLAAALPEGGDWVYEQKFDGYRILARLDDEGEPRLFTRNGHDWTDRLPDLAKDIASLGVRSAWLDGELVALDKGGRPDFNALQNAFDSGRAAAAAALVWYVFDAPFFGGRDLRQLPLRERRALLSALLSQRQAPRVRFSDALPGDPAASLRRACAAGLEGVMAKRAEAPYANRRNEDWLKIKCAQRQEFIVIGYTDRSDGGSDDFGSLLLGYHDEHGALQYAGNVGTGWDEPARRMLYERLHRLKAAEPPAGIAPPSRGRWSVRSTRGHAIEHWVKPQLVVEVKFGEWTPEGRIRHASFQGVREDKPARQVVREQAGALPSAGQPGKRSAKAASKTTSKTPAARASNAAVRVTHGDRVIDAASGLTKLDLVHYYDSIADHILPHLRGRPVSLVRAPEGVGGQTFFQKHADKRTIPDVTELDPALWPGHGALMEIATREALLQAAQMNVIEFHTWNTKTTQMSTPDRMVFDLDPGEGVGWQQVREAAILTRALLDELGLRCWLKTSGGKGLHVVVPFKPDLGWQPVKDFSRAVVEHLAHAIPDRFVAKSGPRNRQGRIFVDYLRNGEGQTTVAAFSARARPGLGVSVPLDWDELGDVKDSAQWTIANARDRLSFLKADPWAGYGRSRQTLAAAIKRLAKAGSQPD